jgi:hypothetical protein
MSMHPIQPVWSETDAQRAIELCDEHDINLWNSCASGGWVYCPAISLKEHGDEARPAGPFVSLGEAAQAAVDRLQLNWNGRAA